MKKLFSALFIVMMIALACTLVAGAAEVYTPTDGLYNIEYAVPNAENGTQFGMVVIEATGDEAFALDEATIRYIDQVGAANGEISFDAFAPMDLQNNGTYKVYIGGGNLGEATLIGTLATDEAGGGDEPGTEPVEPQGVLGDVNGDNVKNANDAVFLLRHVSLPAFYPTSYAGTKDFNNDGTVSSADAVYLLRHISLPTFYPIAW